MKAVSMLQAVESPTPRGEMGRAPTMAFLLIVFGGAALIAAELIGPAREPTDAKRLVITVAAPGVVQARATRADVPAAGVAASGYGCRHITSLGDVTVGRACVPRALSVAATE